MRTSPLHLPDRSSLSQGVAGGAAVPRRGQAGGDDGDGGLADRHEDTRRWVTAVNRDREAGVPWPTGQRRSPRRAQRPAFAQHTTKHVLGQVADCTGPPLILPIWVGSGLCGRRSVCLVASETALPLTWARLARVPACWYSWLAMGFFKRSPLITIWRAVRYRPRRDSLCSFGLLRQSKQSKQNFVQSISALIDGAHACFGTKNPRRARFNGMTPSIDDKASLCWPATMRSFKFKLRWLFSPPLLPRQHFFFPVFQVLAPVPLESLFKPLYVNGPTKRVKIFGIRGRRETVHAEWTTSSLARPSGPASSLRACISLT